MFLFPNWLYFRSSLWLAQGHSTLTITDLCLYQNETSYYGTLWQTMVQNGNDGTMYNQSRGPITTNQEWIWPVLIWQMQSDTQTAIKMTLREKNKYTECWWANLKKPWHWVHRLHVLQRKFMEIAGWSLQTWAHKRSLHFSWFSMCGHPCSPCPLIRKLRWHRSASS